MKRNFISAKRLGAICIAAVLMTSNVFAAEKAKQKVSDKPEKVVVNAKTVFDDGVLTYDEAYKLAIDNNSSLKELESNVEVMEESKTTLFSSVAMNLPGDVVVSMPSVSLGDLKALNTLDTGLYSTKYSKEMTEKSVGAMVKSSLMTIEKTKRQLATAEKGYEIQKTGHSQQMTMYSLGMISKTDLDKAKDSLDKTAAGVEALKLSLETEYSALNKLMGKDLTLRYTVEYTPDTEPVEIAISEVTSYATRKMASDPYLKIQEAAVEDAKFGLKAYAYDGTSDSYLSKKTKQETASRNFADLKTNMKQAVQSTYNGLKQLEANQKSLEAALNTAKSDLKVAEVNFSVGKLTQLELDTAKLKVQQAEDEVEFNKQNYDSAKYSFENPFLLVMAGGK